MWGEGVENKFRWVEEGWKVKLYKDFAAERTWTGTTRSRILGLPPELSASWHLIWSDLFNEDRPIAESQSRDSPQKQEKQ